MALRSLLGELFDDQLSGARDALPVNVPPVVAPPVLPKPRELVSSLREGASGPSFPLPPPQREACELEDLRVNQDLRARFEPPDETKEPERVGGPNLRRAELVEAPLREEHRLPDLPRLASPDRRRSKRALFGEMVHYLHVGASRPGCVGDHELHAGGTPGRRPLPFGDPARVSQAPGEEEAEHERREKEAGERVGELVDLGRPDEQGRDQGEGSEEDRLPSPGRRPHKDPPPGKPRTFRRL